MTQPNQSFDPIIDEFDAACSRRVWSSGQATELARWLGLVEPDQRLALAEFLIPIEIEYRQRAGLQIDPARDYGNLSEAMVLIVKRIVEENGDQAKQNRVESNQNEDDGRRQNLPVPLLSGERESPGVEWPMIQNHESIVGNYQLVDRLGEGGMGEVWLAEQLEPVKRSVALKLIKTGFGSKEVLARFEAERQALAMMNHPNIARILDAGETADGQPYFAMELVQGLPLTDFCDQHQLGINERLALFSDVCSGVQHAHQKGIIHRDLKPTNVLVTVVDGKAIPKVIDFGLAKAMGSAQRLTDQSLFTGIGQILGTLKYMSPEQASLDANDIDTRTDIYALGVILYELLTGSTPLDQTSIKGQALVKVLDLIREKDPVKPSSRLGNSTGAAVSTIISQRKTDSVRLHRILAGDLDWIVMKALEKDRNRRYESASGFAADVQHYLNSEPVTARPPSINYRLRKFVRKNRVSVATASALVLLMILGVAGTGWGLIKSRRAEKLANEKLVEAIVAKNLEAEQRLIANQQTEIARANEALALREKLVAQAVRSFLQNNLLGSASVWNQANAANLKEGQSVRYNVTVRELLDRAALEYTPTTMEERFPQQPLVQAEILETIGQAYQATGDYDQSLNYLKAGVDRRIKAFGAWDLSNLSSRVDLVIAHLIAHKQLEAVRQALEIVDHLVELLETQDQAVSATSAGEDDLAAVAIAHVVSAIESRFSVQQQSLPTIGFSAIDGALAWLQMNQALTKVQRLHELCVKKFGVNERRTLFAEMTYAGTLHATGQVGRALELYERVHAVAEVELAEDDLLLAGFRSVLLAAMPTGNLDLQRMIELREKVVATLTKKLGTQHPGTLSSINDLAGAYQRANQSETALLLLESLLEKWTLLNGPDHPGTLQIKANLARTYQSLEQMDLALPLYQETLKASLRRLGEKHPETLRIKNELGLYYLAAKNFQEAVPLLEETVEVCKSVFGPSHSNTITCTANLAEGYEGLGEVLKSLPLYEFVYARRQASLGKAHPETLYVMDCLANALLVAKEFDKARKFYRESLSRTRAKFGAEHEDTQYRTDRFSKAIDRMMEHYQQTDRLEEVEKLKREKTELDGLGTGRN